MTQNKGNGVNISTVIGVFVTLGLLVAAVLFDGNSLRTYLDIPAFIIIFGGSYFVMYTFSGTLRDSFGMLGLIRLTFRMPKFDEHGIILKLMAMSEKARREGLLALEEELEDLDDEFMKKGMRLAIDGTDAQIIRELMENDLNQMQARHGSHIATINTWAGLAPGLGMTGTLIGLVGMLKNLQDKSALGPHMAVALVCTLYGAITANALLIPFGGKLKNYDAMESKVKEMQIEGVLSIQAGDNPRILATKLLSFVNPEDRKTLEAEIIKD